MWLAKLQPLQIWWKGDMKPTWCTKEAPCDFDKGSAYCPHRECQQALVAEHDQLLVSVGKCGVRLGIANARIELLEEVAVHANRLLKDPSWNAHQRNLKSALAKLEQPNG